MEDGGPLRNELITFTDIVNKLGIHSLLINFGTMIPPELDKYVFLIRGRVDEDY